jgi:nucleotide-binding universal stress UspA family protein
MKILLAVDGSACSDAAVTEVARRSLPAGSAVRILHAIEPYPTYVPELWTLPPMSYDQLEKLERERARLFLGRAAAELAEAGVPHEAVTTSVVVGPPKEVILEEAESWGADLIVVGSHGRGAVKRFLLGSVSQAVALHARCSVEIVRSKEASSREAA